MSDAAPTLRLGHSPDPDDAFMWWPLFEQGGAPPRIDTGRFRFEPVAEDIETLNRRAETADLEITAMSCAQYPRVRERYAITACGASLGERYGPKLVAREPCTIDELRRRLGEPAGEATLAVPGERTSAFAVTSLMLGPGAFRYRVVPFETIIETVSDGGCAAGVVIHEGQLTYAAAGLHLVEDLGAWWWARHALPMPLGVNAIRRDLDTRYGRGTITAVTSLLLRSVHYAMEHREASIEHALGFARGMSADVADEFVKLYVNERTLDFGDDGRAAVRALLDEMHAAGLAPPVEAVDFVMAS